jgi:hypothetical protein
MERKNRDTKIIELLVLVLILLAGRLRGFIGGSATGFGAEAAQARAQTA